MQIATEEKQIKRNILQTCEMTCSWSFSKITIILNLLLFKLYTVMNWRKFYFTKNVFNTDNLLMGKNIYSNKKQNLRGKSLSRKRKLIKRKFGFVINLFCRSSWIYFLLKVENTFDPLGSTWWKLKKISQDMTSQNLF